MSYILRTIRGVENGGSETVESFAEASDRFWGFLRDCIDQRQIAYASVVSGATNAEAQTWLSARISVYPERPQDSESSSAAQGQSEKTDS